MTRRLGFALSAIGTLLLAAAPSALADSHVRIVRLSYVDGQVKVDRAAGQGLERAVLNTPIVEGTRLVTGGDGLAEVEFEDQSVLRLAGDTEIHFRQLLINDAGAKVNEIAIDKGVVYLDVRARKDIYRVSADGASLLVTGDAQVRLSAASDQLRVAVSRGDVQLVSLPQTVAIKKKETLAYDPRNPSAYKVTDGTDALPEDAWNKERQAYANSYASSAGVGPSHAYGLQDLNYYGDYFYAAGYGYVWQPFGFADSLYAWSPFTNGAWMFYPGMGYSWTSSYPWGWLPYHYGSWAFLSNAGWVWVPGNNLYRGSSWYATSFQPTAVIKKAPAGWTAPKPPSTATESVRPTVLVGSTHGAPPAIPGGRVPPNFSSVIAGRSAGPSASKTGFTRSNASRLQSGNVGARAGQPGGGHVFAAPARASAPSALGAPDISSHGSQGTAAIPPPSSAASSAHAGSTHH